MNIYIIYYILYMNIYISQTTNLLTNTNILWKLIDLSLLYRDFQLMYIH